MAKHSIEASEEGGVRYLHFGSEWVQGAMRVARPWALELEYTREMMACVLLRGDDQWPRNVLQVGLGAASLAKFWHRHFPGTRQHIIEINPDVVALAHQAFKLPHDPDAIAVHIADGVAWMREVADGARNNERRFDCIMVDGYDEHARFGGLGTEAFYRDCRNVLSPRGMLVLNLFGRSRGYDRQIAKLKQVFGEVNGGVLALPAHEGLGGGNSIVFAWHAGAVTLDLERLRADAVALHAATGLKLESTLSRIERALASQACEADAMSSLGAIRITNDDAESTSHRRRSRAKRARR